MPEQMTEKIGLIFLNDGTEAETIGPLLWKD
jgi:hypothetical protein